MSNWCLVQATEWLLAVPATQVTIQETRREISGLNVLSTDEGPSREHSDLWLLLTREV